MSTKVLTQTFVTYGIRKEDCAILEALSRKHDLDYDWIQENRLTGNTFK
jgi:hypothetical protein